MYPLLRLSEAELGLVFLVYLVAYCYEAVGSLNVNRDYRAVIHHSHRLGQITLNIGN